MSAAAALATVGGIARNAAALMAGAVLGGIFILFWLVVAGIENVRHK